ncbi:ribonuclease H family protein [uncultured Anaerococcus sp.]|uniref:ribonuclease H family protein n=1 Tax=uncultured Anaerococcus sp. TaxID=293428 RepID=UPI002889DE73|nr:ribonuclease H family protein [uncultured Anaerococcus sp.]
MKYYAVKRGRNPGIYTSWDACLKEVKGFSNASYKSFKTKAEAIAFMEDSLREVEVDDATIIAYVDGSYNLNDKIYGSGVVYISKNGEEELYATYTDDFYQHRNVAGEVKASELAIKKALRDKAQKIIIYHDYQGISSWANDEWKANNELTKAYKAFIKEARRSLEIGFVKVKGHSNDKYNDWADRLAKKAAKVES